MKLRPCVAALAVAAAALTSCSSPAPEGSMTKQISEATIEDQLAAELALGSLEARCPDVTEPTVNTNFLCMATTPQDQAVNVEATIRPSGKVEVRTTNVIRAAALGGFERRAVADINGATGSELLENDLDCGSRTAVLDTSRQMVCAVANQGSVYDVTLTVKDIEETLFDLEVAQSPRS